VTMARLPTASGRVAASALPATIMKKTKMEKNETACLATRFIPMPVLLSGGRILLGRTPSWQVHMRLGFTAVFSRVVFGLRGRPEGGALTVQRNAGGRGAEMAGSFAGIFFGSWWIEASQTTKRAGIWQAKSIRGLWGSRAGDKLSRTPRIPGSEITHPPLDPCTRHPVKLSRLMTVADGSYDFLGVAILAEMVANSSLAGHCGRWGVWVHGQDNNPGFWEPGPDDFGRIQPVHDGHAGTDQDHVGLVLYHNPDRIKTVFWFSDNRQSGFFLKDQSQCLSEICLVINDSDSHG
jgi:hypothetical protein